MCIRRARSWRSADSTSSTSCSGSSISYPCNYLFSHNEAVYRTARGAKIKTITIYSFLISSRSHDLSFSLSLSLSMQCINLLREPAPNAMPSIRLIHHHVKSLFYILQEVLILIAIFVPSLCTPHPSFHFVCPFITISRRYL